MPTDTPSAWPKRASRSWILHRARSPIRQNDDGALVIADFKTDIRVTEETIAGYWRQPSTYADMVERIIGQQEKELVLIFCRVGVAEVRRRTCFA